MAVGYGHLLTGDDDEDEDEDIDDLWDASTKPLLLEDDADSDEGGVENDKYNNPLAEPDDPLPLLDILQRRRARGIRWLFGKPRKKGICPLCNEPVRSGAHLCQRAQGTLQAGIRSDSERESGNMHFRAGRYKEAVNAYSAALVDAPDDERLFSNRAAAHMAILELEHALKDSEAAIRLAPSWPKGYFRKALVLEAYEDWNAAADVYRQLLRSCSASAAREQSKAASRLVAARARKAMQDLPKPFANELVNARWKRLRDAGAEVVSDEEEYRRRLTLAESAKADGNEKVGLREWSAARQCYLQGIRLLRFCPAEPWEEQARLEAALQLNQALCEGHLSQHAVVEELCAAVLVLDPTNIKARFRRATALGELEEYDRAVEEVQVAVGLQPGDSELLALRRRLQGKRRALLQRQQIQCARMLGAAGKP